MCRVYCIFLIIILLYIMLDKKEYFTIRETLAEKRADEIIKNRQFFNNDFSNIGQALCLPDVRWTRPKR